MQTATAKQFVFRISALSDASLTSSPSSAGDYADDHDGDYADAIDAVVSQVQT